MYTRENTVGTVVAIDNNTNIPFLYSFDVNLKKVCEAAYQCELNENATFVSIEIWTPSTQKSTIYSREDLCSALEKRGDEINGLNFLLEIDRRNQAKYHEEAVRKFQIREARRRLRESGKI